MRRIRVSRPAKRSPSSPAQLARMYSNWPSSEVGLDRIGARSVSKSDAPPGPGPGSPAKKDSRAAMAAA